MRRFWIALLAFLGVACIAAAIAIPTYLVPKLKVVPLDLDITSDSSSIAPEGQSGNRFPAVILDRCSINQPRVRQLDANLSQQRRTVIVDPSDANQATIQAAQTVLVDRTRNYKGEESTPTVAGAGDERKCTDGLLTANIDRVSLNRKTSVPNGKVSSLQLEAAPEGVSVDEVSVRLDDRKGFQYKFGFDVKKTEYYYYDLNTRQDTVAKFVDEKVINGVKTYHFTTDVPETDLSDLPNPQGDAALGSILNMPAKWWGIKGKGVKPNDRIEMHRFAAAKRDVWVEPVTGTIVDGREEQHQYFKSVDDSEDVPAAVTDYRLDALKATFKWSDDTVSQQADRAEHYKGLLKTGGTIVPIILGVVGAILLLIVGFLLFLRRGGPSDDQPAENDDPLLDDSPDTVVLSDGPTEQYRAAEYGDQYGSDDAAGGAPLAYSGETTQFNRHEALTEQFTAADVPEAAYSADEYASPDFDAPLPPVGSPAENDTGDFRRPEASYQQGQPFQQGGFQQGQGFGDVLNPTGSFGAQPPVDQSDDDFGPLSPHLGRHERPGEGDDQQR